MEKSSPVLERLREDLRRNDAEIGADEAGYERLGDRHDVRADVEREQIRPRLQARYAKRDRLLQQIAVEEKRAELVDVLDAARTQEIAEAMAIVDAIKADASDPDPAPVKDWAIRTRRVNELNRLLHTATGAPKYAKEIDFVDQVKWFWHQQQIARNRIFTHHLAPVMRSQLTAAPPPWAEAATRLSQLPSPKEDLIHAR
jgi:hypothetical protein